MHYIEIVDLFAGPGGLGEGFSSFQSNGLHPFKIAISAEKNKFAQGTLRLRAFWRLLKRHGKPLDSLYAYYKSEKSTPWSQNTKDLWDLAGTEALQLELGKEEDNARLYDRIAELSQKGCPWVLIGGPPCQAYSVIGRVRSGIDNNSKDERHYLYREYLNVIRRFRPSIFVMENVRGLLSCQLNQTHIIHRILEDLSIPGKSEHDLPNYRYKICSLVGDLCYEPGMDPSKINLRNFVVQCERYGIPQARHRVILLGIREDITNPVQKLVPSPTATVRDAIGDMPPLRSGVSRQADSVEIWKQLVVAACNDLANEAQKVGRYKLADLLLASQKKILHNYLTRGGRWLNGNSNVAQRKTPLQEWLCDDTLGGWANHETREHMASDLRRYLYAASYACLEKKNPVGSKGFDLPGLAPNHANWESGHFDDRFKAQLENFPSTTITSHLSKDGHSFIHPDPAQCRSLTVREAARLQTFPDNYFFEGPRTAQYEQVGNAVPPLLARQIAKIVWNVLQGTALRS